MTFRYIYAELDKMLSKGTEDQSKGSELISNGLKCGGIMTF